MTGRTSRHEKGRQAVTERTIIVGAGGFGRELIQWAGDCHNAGRLPPLAGIVDDKSDALAGFDYDVSIIGAMDDFTPLPGDHLLMAIGTPAIKQRVAERFVTRGGRFASLIHPTAIVATSARIGDGTILCPLSLVSANATIGRLCTVNALSSIGHDVHIGDYTTLSAHVDLTGAAQVGHSVLIGTGAKVLPRVRIGNDATIGSGSVVYRSVRAGSSVFAAPAKTLRSAGTDSASR